MPALMGFKLSGLAAITLFTLTVFVLKALAVTKLALAVASGILIAKVFAKPKPKHMQPDNNPTENYFTPAQYNTAQGR